MTLPRQPFGINKFSTSFSVCPPNPDAIRAIVIQRNNLDVVNGATTELELLLTGLFVTVDSASKLSFTLPAKSSAIIPMSLYDLDFRDDNVKFLCLYPQYGTAINTNQYVEWTTRQSLTDGTLYDKPPIIPNYLGGPTASGLSSLDINQVNSLQFGWGSNMSYTGGTGPLWIGTNGGLLKWNGTDMKLWSTLNSPSLSDYINSIVVDTASNLWIGASGGLSYFNEITGFSRQFTEANSDLINDTVNDVKLLSVDRVVAATDAGVSIYNFAIKAWETFDIYSTPELTINKIDKLAVVGAKIFLGTTGGVFMYDSSTLTWNSLPFNSTNTPGWTAPDSITALAAYGMNIYAGTTGGIVQFPYAGGTATTIVAGGTGPQSNNITSLRYALYGSSPELYVGHDNAISVLDINSNTWTLGFNTNISGIVKDLIPDFLSGSTGDKTIFYGATPTGGTTSGLYKIFTTTPDFSPVPETNKRTNILLTYPNTYDSLYSNNQPLYVLFSKPVGATAFGNVISVNEVGTPNTSVSGAWTGSTSGQVYRFDPTLTFGKASNYYIGLTQGATAVDGSYISGPLNVNFYTEDFVPENGWNTLGKIMILTGTDEHYLQSLYLRNPQSFEVTVNALIGIII